MENSEVDLLPMMEIIWKKKKQILFYTVLIVIASVLFSLLQPKYYETRKTAFVLQSNNNIYAQQKVWPAEYYEKFAKSPKIIQYILRKLPQDKTFRGKILTFNDLNTSLHVQSNTIQPIGAFTTSAIKLTLFVRHTNPVAANKIANTWQNALENNFPEFNSEQLLSEYSEKQNQLQISKSKWEENKKRLTDFKKNYNTRNKELELQSIHRLIAVTNSKSEEIMNQIDPSTIFLEKAKRLARYKSKNLKLKEDFYSAKETLSEYKKLRDHQPKVITLSANHASGLEGDIPRTQNGKIFNPVYTSLQEAIFSYETYLKTLEKKISLTGKMVSGELKLESNEQSQVFENADILKKKHQIKLLKEKIKQYEKASSRLEIQITEKKLEERNLIKKETALANLYNDNSRKFNELELIKTSKPRSLDFSLSNVEPAVFLGSSMKSLVFIAFGAGLVFMTLITLIKFNFNSKNTKEQNEDADIFYGNTVYTNKENIRTPQTVPDSKVSKPPKEPDPALATM